MNELQIRNAITANLAMIAGVNNVLLYNEEMQESDLTGNTPLIMLEQRPVNYGDDFGADVHAEILGFSALVCVRANDEDSLATCRELTRKVAARVERTSWGLADLGVAELGDVDWEDPRPDWQQYRVMQVDWTHHALLETT